jgi:hypothetical protein
MLLSGSSACLGGAYKLHVNPVTHLLHQGFAVRVCWWLCPLAPAPRAEAREARHAAVGGAGGRAQILQHESKGVHVI